MNRGLHRFYREPFRFSGLNPPRHVRRRIMNFEVKDFIAFARSPELQESDTKTKSTPGVTVANSFWKSVAKIARSLDESKSTGQIVSCLSMT